MIKKIILLLISLFLFSCTSSLGGSGIKFKDRNGIYQDNSRNVSVEVTTAEKQNLIIKVNNYNGVILNDVYDITSAVTTGKFNLKSVNNSEYFYVLNFYANRSVVFSVIKGLSYPINNLELKK